MTPTSTSHPRRAESDRHPLSFAGYPATSGTDALVLGYDGGDSVVATPGVSASSSTSPARTSITPPGLPVRCT